MATIPPPNGALFQAIVQSSMVPGPLERHTPPPVSDSLSWMSQRRIRIPETRSVAMAPPGPAAVFPSNSQSATVGSPSRKYAPAPDPPRLELNRQFRTTGAPPSLKSPAPWFPA